MDTDTARSLQGSKRQNRFLNKLVRPIAALALLYGIWMIIGDYVVDLVIRRSPEYKLGMDTFRSSPKAHKILGDNLEAAGGHPRESGSTIGNDGSEELYVPVSGTIQKGTLYIRASEASGRWQVDELAIRVEGQSTWNVLYTWNALSPAISR
jgi:hypothetical protein